MRGRAERPRRARRDAHGVGQVALLPAAGAAARGPDDRRLAARGADAGPGRGARRRAGSATGSRSSTRSRTARPTRARSARASRGRADAAVRRAGAVLDAGLRRADGRGRRRAVRGRRGALRVAVGARLPARLLPAGRRRALPRRPGARRVDGDGDAAGGRRHRAAAGAARPGAGRDRLRPAEHLVHARCGRRRTRSTRCSSARCRATTRCRRSSTRARAPGSDELAARLREDLGVEARGLPRGPRPRDARDGAAALPGRRGRRGRRHQRVRHGRRQAQRADGHPLERAGVARGVLPGGRPRAGATAQPARALLLAENRDKALHVHFIKRDELDERLPERLADQLLASAEDAGPARAVDAALRGRRRRRRAARSAATPTSCARSSATSRARA